MSLSLTPPSGAVLNMLLLCVVGCFALVAYNNLYLTHYVVFYLHISLQVQKKNYRQEKKRAAKELFSALKDPSVVIISNWLKV